MQSSRTHRLATRARLALVVVSTSLLLALARGAAGQGPPTLNADPNSFGTVNSAPAGPMFPVAPPALPAGSGPWPAGPLIDAAPAVPWTWQAVPDGLIYRSYLAGVKEPRLSVVMGNARGFGAAWDATLGGRVGLLRYGTPNAYRPEGWQLDFEGAALPRLQPSQPSSPLVSTDYRVGFPITYGMGAWQFKTGYAHVSAHLGDEYMLLHPTVTRVNYVRDAVMLGLGYFYSDDLRLFGEIDYGVGVSGGAEPWEFQFGADYSPAIRGGAPFAAVYADIRPEVNGGYFVVQAGWQRRGGEAMHTLRVGVEYLNGKSPQFEFYRQFEQHTGVGIWYDY